MSEDHCITSLGGGIDVQSGDVMAEMELPPGGSDSARFRQLVGPIVVVDIVADSEHRRDLGKCFEDVAGADVTGMKDQIRTMERGHRLAPDQPVSI